MTTYVYRDGKLVEKSEATPLPISPQIMRDIPEYRSPLGTGTISSRSHRREDLKRANCREVDPSEFKPTYLNERFARKHGLPFGERD